jgi:phosphopantetheinyl transferase
VDLKEPANARKSRDSRFLKKILTAAEIEFVQGAKNSDQALWSFWACKEASYKVIKKKYPDARFLPRRWQVLLRQTASSRIGGEVVIPAKDKVYVRVFFHTDYVHCIGADDQKALKNVICKVKTLEVKENTEEKDASLFLRQSLAQGLIAHLHLNPSNIKIKREKEQSGLGPPRLYMGGKKSVIDISLSHDGRFVAYAFLT